MKQLFTMLVLLITLSSANIFAKDAVTKTSIKVYGSCDMCKERIEKAAKIKGVKSAIWSEQSHILTITFVPTKTNLEQIEESITNAGYDTDKKKAPDAAYQKLPQCCQYERK